MVRSRCCEGMPRPTDSAPCGSRSTSSTVRPCSTSAAPRLMVDVVLPTPPFWLHMAMIRAGPWELIGFGSGSLRCRALAGSTRLVGMPISASPAMAPPRGSATADAAASARVDIVCASSLGAERTVDRVRSRQERARPAEGSRRSVLPPPFSAGSAATVTGTPRKLVGMVLLTVPYHLDERLDPFDLGVPADRELTADLPAGDP